MIKIKKIKKGFSLVELLLTIVVISVGIFPLLSGLGVTVDSALQQKDQISAITIGKLQMDRWLNQFQLIDYQVKDISEKYPENFTVYYPPIPEQQTPLLNEQGEPFRDLRYNGAFFRTESIFTKRADLSSHTRVIYQIKVVVWRIKNPLMSYDLKNIINTSFGPPGFERGDEIFFELVSLYAQSVND
jgi:prepilin-type N-terminal cleavage/methylation domain-containing protein